MTRILQLIHSNISQLAILTAQQQLKELAKNFTIVKINGYEIDLNHLANELETQNDIFSTQPRLFYIVSLTENSQFKEISNYIYNLLDQNAQLNILFRENKLVPKNTRFFKIIKELGQITEISIKNKSSFKTWANQYIQGQDISIPAKLIPKLAKISNYNPETFINNLQKLTLYQKINEETINQILSNTLEESIWSLLEEINYKNTANAIQKLSELFNQHVNEHYILSMLIYNIRQILLLKLMQQQNLSKQEIIKKARIPPFNYSKYESFCKKVPFNNIKKIYNKLYDLDYKSKTGQIDLQTGLTLLVGRLL